MRYARVLATAIMVGTTWSSGSSALVAADIPKSKPNILLIVADDMGYSDLGCYGGEIRTPNLDALAKRGVRFTEFYASPTSSPSRSMLLTGTDNHVAGLGNMAEWLGPTQRNQPGYEGHLNDRVVTNASLMRGLAGYFTFMAGKWHLGERVNDWPAAHGFSRDFTMLEGMGSHWGDMQAFSPEKPKLFYSRNGEKVETLPAGYFSSTHFTDFAIGCIDESRAQQKPFFAYVAYQAPHGPLAAPDAWIDRNRGAYDAGYDAVGDARLARQKTLGIVGSQVQRAPRYPGIPPWSALTQEEQHQSARRMEIYAAMVEHMDNQIGRLLDHLKANGQYDNTLIVFMSDNGANGEDHSQVFLQHAPQLKPWLEKTFDNRFENWGRQGSFIDYGRAWGQVSNVPFRLFKGVVAEGGIRVPLIVSGPGVPQDGTINRSPAHIMDITPSLLELAGIEHPSQEKGSTTAAPQGKSLVPMLAGRVPAVRTGAEFLGWELFGNRAIRQDHWKLLYLLKGADGIGDWQLFNLRDDPAEMHDLASTESARRDTLRGFWQQYVKDNGVIESDAGPFTPRD